MNHVNKIITAKPTLRNYSVRNIKSGALCASHLYQNVRTCILQFTIHI